MGKYDVFGSVAVPANAPSFASRRAVVSAVKFIPGLVTVDLGTLKYVNNAINKRIKYTPDPSKNDTWSSPEETLRKGTGDCEDIALLKMAALKTAGWQTEDLQIVVINLPDKRQHCVLVAHSPMGPMVLCNLAFGVVPDHKYPCTPLVSFVGDDSFLHGKSTK